MIIYTRFANHFIPEAAASRKENVTVTHASSFLPAPLSLPLPPTPAPHRTPKFNVKGEPGMILKATRDEDADEVCNSTEVFDSEEVL